MLKSMTAYGKTTHTFSAGRVDVEIQTVNRKHLEVNVSLPQFLVKFDAQIKKWIAEHFARGQVNVKIVAIPHETSPVAITPNCALAKQIKAAWHLLAEDLKIEIDDHSLIKILLQDENLMVYTEDKASIDQYQDALKNAVLQTIQVCLKMKAQEGSALQEDILGRFKIISALIDSVEGRSAGASDRYRQKLMQRLHEILQAPITEDERLLREVALFAEKIDVAEEITRLKSHLNQALEVLYSDKEAAGKTMEFIIQEINREINTIGSKCQDVEISRSVIELKSELERIREQIQNVE